MPEESRAVHGITRRRARGRARLRDGHASRLGARSRARFPSRTTPRSTAAFIIEEIGRAAPEGMTPGDMPPAARDEVVWVDPLVWAREILKELKSRRLGDVAKHLGIPLEQAHRAAGDAEATGRVSAFARTAVAACVRRARAAAETLRGVSGGRICGVETLSVSPKVTQARLIWVPFALMAFGSWTPTIWHVAPRASSGPGRQGAPWRSGTRCPPGWPMLFVPGSVAEATDPRASRNSAQGEPLVGHRVVAPVALLLVGCSRSFGWLVSSRC